ncbi:MAG: ABC transporter ATP-binding protein [Clostridiaceae bacterium]
MNESSFAIQLNNISKIVNKRKIADDVSLDIEKGEIFGLLGANGAGKTTIMRMLTGLIKPTSGSISINGIGLNDDFEKCLASIGAIIESPQLYNNLTGQMNLKIMANMYLNVDNERIHEVAKLVKIDDRLKDKVKTYSLGMRQRLGIAVALLNKPDILILDEPVNGLDPEGVKEVRDTLKELAHNQNACVVISSHILSEMELMCDRFAIINKGKIIDIKEINNKEVNDRSNKVMKVCFETLKTVIPSQIKEILSSFEITEVDFENNKFIIKQDSEIVAKVIEKLVQANIAIISVVPQRDNLEDYFMKKMGEVVNE